MILGMTKRELCAYTVGAVPIAVLWWFAWVLLP